MKTFVFIAMAAILFLGACASPGELVRIGFTMPNKETGTILAHDQRMPDSWIATDKLALNVVVKGDVSDIQLEAIAEAERACRIYTGIARPHSLVAVLWQGTLFAGAGFIGGSLAARLFPNAIPSESARITATDLAFAGTASGTINLGGKIHTFENCGDEIFKLFPSYDVHILRR